MEVQLLRDPSEKPTDEMIAAGLGGASDTYVKFIEGLERRGITLMGWRYYNDGKSWLNKGEYKWVSARGAAKVKPICWLSIWDGFFKVSFFFSGERRGELLSLPLSQAAKAIVTNAETLGKTGRFLPIVFDVGTDELLEDVFVLAEYRKEKG